MTHQTWQYESARDIGVPFADRLERWPREPDPLVYTARFAAALAIRTALRLFHRYEVVGRDNIPRDGSIALVANHSSHLDTPALMSALPLAFLHRTHAVAARDYFCARKLRMVLAAVVTNAVFVHRDERGLIDLEVCRRVVEERRTAMMIFPEGTRSMDGCIGAFKRGVGYLLAGSRCSAVPCFIGGTRSAWPKGSRFPHPYPVRVVVGEPRTYEHVGRTDAGYLRICDDLRRGVVALSWKSAAQTQQQTEMGSKDDRFSGRDALYE